MKDFLAGAAVVAVLLIPMLLGLVTMVTRYGVCKDAGYSTFACILVAL